MTTVALLGLGAADPRTAAAGYELMGLIGTRAIAASAITTVLTGLMLSATTPWGFVRFRWVVVKSVISLVVIVSAVRMTNAWVEAAAVAALGLGEREPAAWLAVAGAASHLLLLAAATVISVDKPWGRTRWGQLRAR
jgi:hypothetical protein